MCLVESELSSDLHRIPESKIVGGHHQGQDLTAAKVGANIDWVGENHPRSWLYLKQGHVCVCVCVVVVRQSV